MQHRTLVLALSLFGISCSPPSTEPAHPTNQSASAAVSAPAPVTPSSEPTAMAATATATAAAAPAPLDSSKGSSKVKGAPSAAPAAAVVDSKEPLTGGTLTQEDVRKILEKSGDLFGDCYTIGAGSKTKEFIATVRIKATLGPSGAVNAAQVVGSTAKNPKVDACVSQAFKKIKFPAPKNGGTSVITFPIQFGGLERVEK
jgi:TonB family protein